jgi:hypothetical protein
MTVLTLRPLAAPRGRAFTPVVEYEFNGRKGTMREAFDCADPRLAKSFAAIACAKFLARLPVPRSFDIVVEN